MTEDTDIRLRITKNIHSFGRLRLPAGAVVRARIGLYGRIEAEVADSRYVPLLPDQWELVVDDRDLQRLLDSR